jgi:hypothetical protein
MRTRGRALKLTAVVAMMGLALTGFSTGRGHGHKSRSDGDGGGGGCSSSSQDHDSSSSSTTSGGSTWSGSDDDSDDYYGSGSGSGSSSGGGSSTRRPGYGSTPSASSSGKALEDGEARLISCATAERPYATVEITNPNSREAEFQAWVTFYDAEGTLLLMNSSFSVEVPAHGRASTRVTLGKRFLASVDHCEADLEAEVSP